MKTAKRRHGGVDVSISSTHAVSKDLMDAEQRIYDLQKQLVNALTLMRSYGSQLNSVADAIERAVFPKSKRKKT